MQKCDFKKNGHHFIVYFKQLGQNFALHSGINQDMCLQNIIWIFVGPGQRFKNTFWIISLLQRLQAYQTHTSCGTYICNVQECKILNSKFPLEQFCTFQPGSLSCKCMVCITLKNVAAESDWFWYMYMHLKWRTVGKTDRKPKM